MVEEKFDEDKDEYQVMLEKTKDEPPKKEELLKKQEEFEFNQKKLEAEEIKGSKKKSRLETIITWGIIILVSISLFFLAKWLLF
jgi:hypothetical protein